MKKSLYLLLALLTIYPLISMDIVGKWKWELSRTIHEQTFHLSIIQYFFSDNTYTRFKSFNQNQTDVNGTYTVNNSTIELHIGSATEMYTLSLSEDNQTLTFLDGNQSYDFTRVQE